MRTITRLFWIVALVPMLACAEQPQKIISYEKPIHPLLKGMAVLLLEQYDETENTGLNSDELSKALEDMITYKLMPPPHHQPKGLEKQRDRVEKPRGENHDERRMGPPGAEPKLDAEALETLAAQLSETYDKSKDGSLQEQELICMLQANANHKMPPPPHGGRGR